MPDVVDAYEIRQDEAFTLMELVGWSSAFLESVFRTSGYPLPSGPGLAIREGACLAMRLTPEIAWLLIDAGAPQTDIAVPPEKGCQCDLTHGRVRIRLDGPASASILSKVVALDPDPDVWRTGSALATGIHGVPVVIHRRDTLSFDLLVPRSFARSLREWLQDASSEFGRYAPWQESGGLIEAVATQEIGR